MKLSLALAAGLSIGCMLAGTPALAQDVPAALRPYMSAEEFRAAGLHKLNPAELAQFQAWFVRAMRAGGDDPLARTPEARPSLPAVAGGDPLEIERRRLAEERRQLEADRRALSEERARLEAMPAQSQQLGVGMVPLGVSADDPRVFGTPGSSGLDSITAIIPGEFDGWDGPTRIVLANGQVWETTESLAWHPRRPIQDASVTIYKATFGRYQLRVEGYNRRVDVRRIE